MTYDSYMKLQNLNQKLRALLVKKVKYETLAHIDPKYMVKLNNVVDEEIRLRKEIEDVKNE